MTSTRENMEFYECPDGNKIYGMCLDGIRYPPFVDVINKVKVLPNYRVNDTDIVICSYPKSGTNWVMNIIQSIMHKDNLRDEHFRIPNNYFVELSPPYEPGEYEARKLLATHVKPRYLPRDVLTGGKGALIFVTRNPKDTIISYYHYMQRVVDYKGTFASFFNMFMDGKWYYSDWFDYVIAFHELLGNAKGRYLVVNFEDTKQNPRQEVRKIAKYLHYEISEGDIDFVLDKSSLDAMKSQWAKSGDVNTVSTYRKGLVGDWKNYFTVAMNERFDTEYKRRLAGTGITRTFELD